MWQMQVKFYLGQKMETEAQKIAPQIALRNCSKEAEGRVSTFVILMKKEYMQSSTCFSRRFLTSLVKLLLVTRNTHHHEEF